MLRIALGGFASLMLAAATQSFAASSASDIELSGYIRLGATTIYPDRFFGVGVGASDNDTRNPLVGRNDGFLLSDARLNVRSQLSDDLSIRLGFEGALRSFSSDIDQQGDLSTGLKDAYFIYKLSQTTLLTAGRFKPPFDIESLTSDKDRLFVHEALESRGVQPHEGYHADLHGMAYARQLGVMIADESALEMAGVALGYALAVTNGNQGDAALNDNDLPAAWARLSMGWGGKGVSDREEGPASMQKIRNGGKVGVSTFFNRLSTGLPPNRLDDDVLGFGADLRVNYYGVTLESQILMVQTSHITAAQSFDETALGWHASLSYELLRGLFLGYRAASYDPRRVSDDISADDGVSDYDEVMHHTAALRYDAETMPLFFVAEYTHSAEASGRELANDRFEAVVQVNF